MVGSPKGRAHILLSSIETQFSFFASFQRYLLLVCDKLNDRLTNRKRNHLLFRVGLDFHGLQNGPDGIEGVLAIV